MSNPIPVAMCITDLDVGGAEKCFTELVTRLDRQRFKPVVYCLGKRPREAERSFAPRLENAGIEVHFLGATRIWFAPILVVRLAGHFRRQKPQLVQSFLFHANIIARLAAWFARVPTVISGIRVAEHGSRWHLRIDTITAGFVDQYVCVSKSVAEFSRVTGKVAPGKIHVIGNGIDLSAVDREGMISAQDLGLPADRRMVTFVGRLDEQKGLEMLLQGAPEWLAEFPDHDLVIVGDGPLRSSLGQLSSRLGIDQRVRFLGWQQNVLGILKGSRLFVLPSKWEGMPNALLEAMAVGLPAVCSDVEGAAELLGDKNPQLVSERNAAEFAARIEVLLRDSSLRSALGTENRRRVEQQFSMHKMVTAYETLYSSLLAAHAGRIR